MEFNLDKNIHMYHHRLTIKWNDCTYRGIIEENPLSDNHLFIWLKDFHIPEELELSLRAEFYTWLMTQGYTCSFKDGSRV